MTRFPTAGHLASWAGTSPGSNESAGKVKSTRTRPGEEHRYLNMTFLKDREREFAFSVA